MKTGDPLLTVPFSALGVTVSVGSCSAAWSAVTSREARLGAPRHPAPDSLAVQALN